MKKQKLTQSVLRRIIKEEKTKLLKEDPSSANKQMWAKIGYSLKKWVFNNHRPEDAAGIMLMLMQEATDEVNDKDDKYWSKFADRLRNSL